MGRYGFHVVDADGHIWEAPQLYDRLRDHYLEGRYQREMADLIARQRAAGEQARPWMFRAKGPFLGMGRPLGVPAPETPVRFRSDGASKKGTRSYAAPLDPAQRLLDMDEEGIDAAVVFPSALNGWSSVDDPLLEAAVYRAYNRFMADYCAHDPRRLKYVAVVSMRYIEDGVAGIRRAAQDPCVASVYSSTHMDGKQLDHPSFHPLWAAAQDLDLPVTIHHDGPTLPPWALGVWEMTESWFQLHASCNPYEQMRAATTLIGGGVLEKFPRLRVAFLEAGCGWLPWWLERLDEHYEMLPDWVPLLKHEPSHFFRNGQCFASFDPDEVALPFVLQALGDGPVVYASDWPHFDCKFPDSVRIVAQRRDLSDAAKRKVLGENARRLYPRVG